MKALMIISIFTFSLSSHSQSEELPFQKEAMNNYLDTKAEHIQNAKDCVMNAMTEEEVKECKVLLEETFEDHARRIRENKNEN